MKNGSKAELPLQTNGPESVPDKQNDRILGKGIPYYFKLFLETLQEGLFLVEKNELLFVNRRLCEILSISKRNITWKGLIERLASTEDPNLKLHLEYLSQGKEFSPVTYNLIETEEERLVIQLSVKIIDWDGRDIYCGQVIDKTRELTVESELFASITILNAVFNSIEDGICVIDDKKYGIKSSNKGIERFFGYHSEELDGQHIRKLAHDKEAFDNKIIEIHQQLPKLGTIYFEMEMQQKNGSPFPAILRLSEVIDDLTNETMALLLIITDVTQRIHLDRTLAELESRYHPLFDRSSDAIVVIDEATGKIVEFNQALENHTGYSRNELIGKPVEMLISSERRTSFSDQIKKLHASGSVIFDGINLTKHGGRIPVQCSLALTKLAGRSVIIASCRDISDQLEIERERMRIVKLDAVRNIAGGIAHEISQPLQSLVIISDIVTTNRPDSEKVREYLSKIPSLVGKMNQLLNQMKRIVRLETKSYAQESDIIDIGKSTDSNLDDE